MMLNAAGSVFGLIWLVWLALWLLWAGWAKPVAKREGIVASLGHRLPLIVAILLLVLRRVPLGFLSAAFLPRDLRVPAIALGLVLTLAGLGFTLRARAILGGNWSSAVALKRGHALIETGPYRLVRHPIYLGIVVALLGGGIALGEWRGLLAPLIAGIAFWIKLRREEGFLIAQFGSEYREYMNRTRALIPCLL
ncbi:MAG: methyltransferase family protein [Candidatus Acidiferrales bacterium]